MVRRRSCAVSNHGCNAPISAFETRRRRRASGSDSDAGLARWRQFWQSARSNRYGMMEPAAVSASSEDLSDTSDKDQKNVPARAGRAAPAAFIHHPRHHRRRRLCVAEGRQLAGGAARSLGAGPGYPQISRSRKRLHRKPARPHRRLAKDAGCGNARPDQGRRFQRARAGRSLTPICANSARAASTKCSAACRATAARSRSCSTATNSRPTTNISSSAARGIRRITGSKPGAPISRARNISRSACATGPTAQTATTSSRRPTAPWCGAPTAKASSMSSSTTTTARCRSGVIAWARRRRTMFWSMRNRIPAGSPISMKAPAAVSA